MRSNERPCPFSYKRIQLLQKLNHPKKSTREGSRLLFEECLARFILSVLKADSSSTFTAAIHSTDPQELHLVTLLYNLTVCSLITYPN